MLASLLTGYPIRLPADQRMFAPPRRFSQLATAFFASIHLGIHHKPYIRLTILLFPGITRLDYSFEFCFTKLLDLLSYSCLEFFARKTPDEIRSISYPSLNPAFLRVIVFQISSFTLGDRGTRTPDI